ncbi:FAD dependent oxidoreductase [Pyrobaculum islandicum DSM 4184]|uniref:FAD dependent oxidoreductase n=1 Tax=Pyrobaculum islandicum (strain DSM 4184 / JCM 9189 / GEO3) TaxID=384616 RepID=A1RS94_PYRIL|nr:FAD-dependent oxidoreductase [Pyrobaculum islandicum]ABL87826.1 FAD dependent oxidoreductase [Pyrobaculum islandicum DSM 4184]
MKFDVAIVGAGPAGLAAAYKLASAGFKVVVLERGREPGAKELYGGRIYAYWLDKYLPEFRKDAPVDRWVRKERVTFLTDDKALTLEFSIVEKEKTSFIVPLVSFVSWMAKLAQNAGAKIVTEITVDRLVKDDKGRFIGVQSGSDTLHADYVIDAEGVNRLLLERAGIVRKLEPEVVAVGVKEVLKFENKKTLEERLGLGEDEGLAWAIAGYPTEYLPGGGFIYTYKDSLALGVVVYLRNWSKLKTPVYDLAERLRLHPYIAPLVKGATLQEYGGHMTPVAGINMPPPRLYYDGLLIVGDAAGFLLHTGVLIRGVDFAIASGVLAAEAIREARSPSAEDLSIYEKKLRNSFILPQLEKYRKADRLLSDETLFRDLTLLSTETAHKYFNVDENHRTLFEALRDASKKTKVNLVKLMINMLRMAKSL